MTNMTRSTGDEGQLMDLGPMCCWGSLRTLMQGWCHGNENWVQIKMVLAACRRGCSEAGGDRRAQVAVASRGLVALECAFLPKKLIPFKESRSSLEMLRLPKMDIDDDR